MQGTTDIKEGTNILRYYTHIHTHTHTHTHTHLYIYIYFFFFGKLEIATHSIVNVNVFLLKDLENYSNKHKQHFPNCAEITTGTKISGETNIVRTFTYWFPTSFFTKPNTALLQ